MERRTTHSAARQIPTPISFGPVAQYDEAATIGGSALRATLSWNLAYRASSIDYSTVSGTTHKTHVAYTEDEKGRYTQKLYTNVDVGIQNDYLQYDWFDRPTCDASVSGSCPASGTTLKTSVSSFNSSNDRSTYHHQDATFGDFGYSVAYNTGADRIASVTWNGRATTMGWTAEGLRTNEDDPSSTVDRRDYTYDGKHRLRTVTLSWKRISRFCSPCWDTVVITYAYDYLDRLVFRDWHDTSTGSESQTFFNWDMYNRLIESKFVPSAGGTNYTVYDFYWLGRRPVAIWAVDQSGTTSRYFIHADEASRPIEMYSWPSSGDASEVWALNPDIFGWDTIATGNSLYQPLRMDGWLYDDGTWPPFSSTATDRPALYVLNGIGYDPMTETTLQPIGTWPNEPYAIANHRPNASGGLARLRAVHTLSGLIKATIASTQRVSTLKDPIAVSAVARRHSNFIDLLQMADSTNGGPVVIARDNSHAGDLGKRLALGKGMDLNVVVGGGGINPWGGPEGPPTGPEECPNGPNEGTLIIIAGVLGGIFGASTPIGWAVGALVLAAVEAEGAKEEGDGGPMCDPNRSDNPDDF